MDPPSELSFDEILKFMLAHNGKVTNHELVNHFRVFLKNPVTRDEARNTFKKHVNTLAVVKKNNDEKWLLLKRKYIPSGTQNNEDTIESKIINDNNDKSASTESSDNSKSMEVAQPPYLPPPPVQLNQDFSILNNIIQDQQEVILRNAPMDITPSVSKESLMTPVDETPPKIHPRRKSSSDKSMTEKSLSSGPIVRDLIPNQDSVQADTPMSSTLSPARSESMLVDSEQKISVKERKQMFNRMASESDVLHSNKLPGSFSPQAVDEEDRVSLDQKSETGPLDSRQKQWILSAARGEYHALEKMIKENMKLVKTKDPFTTAMHWACKRGDEKLVKLLAGVARHLVNERSGYTPLHIAMQSRHENVYNLLVDIYEADSNVRDWSGRKPRQYLVHMDTSLTPGCFRKADTFDMRRSVTTQPAITTNTLNTMSKKEGFLRIGSLNVRVKKTTEAFSNFLGVGATRSSAYIPKFRDREERRSDDGELHKTWGSADNIQKEDKTMPPPMSNKVRRRGATRRKEIGSHSRSTPSTPDQPRAQIGVSGEGDSDSDSAAGFHAAWRQQRASNYT